MMLSTPEGLENFTSEDPVPLSVEIGRYIQSSAAQCGIYTCFALICAGLALFIYITFSCPSCVYRTKKLSFRICTFHYHLVFRGIAAVIVAILTFVFPKLFYTVRKQSDHKDSRVTSHLLFFGREVAFSDKKQRILLLNARRTKIDRVACCCLFTMFLFLAIFVILCSLAVFFSYFPVGGYHGCRDDSMISSKEVCLQLKPNVKPKVINCSKAIEAGIDDNILENNVACYQVSPAIGQASGAALGVFKLCVFLLVLMVHLCKIWLDYLGEVCQCVKNKKVLPVWHSFLTGVGNSILFSILVLTLHYVQENSKHNFHFITFVYKTGPGHNYGILFKDVLPLNVRRIVLYVLIFLACLIIPCLLTYYSRQPLFTINKSHTNREDESEVSEDTASNSRLMEANEMTKSRKYGGVKGGYVPIENSN